MAGYPNRASNVTRGSSPKTNLHKPKSVLRRDAVGVHVGEPDTHAAGVYATETGKRPRVQLMQNATTPLHACRPSVEGPPGGQKPPKQESLSSLCERARHLFESEQDYDGAEELYKSVLAIDPKHVETLCNYALLLETTQVPHA